MGFWSSITSLFKKKPAPRPVPTPAKPVVNPPAPAPVAPTPSQPTSKTNTIRLLNVFENDTGSPNTEYDVIYLYKDGPKKIRQVTLGRGYTECGGALWKVFERYKQMGGKNADALLAYKKYNCKGTLPNNKEFLSLIIKSAREDKKFRDAQDQVFDEIYWGKGFKYFTQHGFKENLSLAVIQDSILHSGSMLTFLTNRFAEKKPNKGGNEKKWIKAYLNTRLNWLSNHSNRILRNTVYRPNFFLSEVKKNNWSFSCPLSGRGSKVCS